MDADYLRSLSQSGIPYAFFSGATQGSANFVLQRRIGLTEPILIAMEDAPSKPDPTGLMMAVQRIEAQQPAAKGLSVLYAGDTAADMKTVIAAQEQFPNRQWIAIGILPPHAQKNTDYKAEYAEKLIAAGAVTVLESVRALNAQLTQKLL